VWYVDDADFMKKMVRYTVPNADIKSNRDAVKHLYCFRPAPQIMPEVVLYYPGYKEKVGDYKLIFYGEELKHSDVCQAIYDYCVRGCEYSKYMATVLKEIYENGLQADLRDDFRISILEKYYNFEQFKTLLYWLTLQEEINYPLSMGYMSVKLPFSRYYEAIYSAYTSSVSIAEIIKRADSKKPYKIMEKLNNNSDDISFSELNTLQHSINS